MTRSRSAVLVGVSLLVLVPSACVLNAAPPDAPAALVSFPAAGQPGGASVQPLSAFSDSRYTSFGKGSGHEAFSSPALGNVTSRGAGQELVIGGMDGSVRVFSHEGALLGRYFAAEGSIEASPVLVDLFGDGHVEIVVATIPPAGSGSNGLGHVVVFDGEGNRLFDQAAGGASVNGFFGTPAVGDIDNDGVPEIVEGGWNQYLYAWHLDGSLVSGFPVFLYDTMWSSPTLADINGDGYLEIIIGGDMDGSNRASTVFGLPEGGLLWVIPHDGMTHAVPTANGLEPHSFYPGYPKYVPGQVVWSSPSVSDIDGDGMLDIVVGTGLNWGDGRGSRVYAWNADGTNKVGFPAATGDAVMASPAIGELDPAQAGYEIAVIAQDGVVTVFSAGGKRLWAQCNMDDRTSCKQGRGHHGTVSIADVNGDGVQEVVSPAEHWLRIFDGRTGSLRADVVLEGGTWVPVAAPLIAAEPDGTARIYVAATLNAVNDGVPGVGDQLKVYRWTTNAPLGRADWPMFRHDPQRTGKI